MRFLLTLIFILGTINFSLAQKKEPNNGLIDNYLKNINNTTDSIHIYVIGKKFIDSIYTDKKNIERVLDSIHKKLIAQGFIYNKLVPDNIIPKSNYLKINYTATNLEAKKINNIFIVNKKHKFPLNIHKFLKKKYLGKLINQTTIKHLKKDLEQTIGLNSVKKIIPVLNKGRTSIRVDLNTEHNNNIDGFLGFQTKEQKIILNALIDLRLSNLFLQNEKINLFWKKNINEQDVTTRFSFPYLFGSLFFLGGETSITNYQNKNFKFFTHFSIGRLFGNSQIGLEIDHNNEISDEEKKSNTFVGTSYKYLFRKQFPEIYKIGLKNYTFNEIGFSVINKNDVNFYSEANYSLPVFKQQFLNFSSIIKYSNDKNTVLKRKLKDVAYRYFSEVTNNNFDRLFLFNLKYFWLKNKFSFYLSSDLLLFRSINTGKKVLNKEVQAGFGLLLFTKNQILTIEIQNRINNTYLTDYQNIMVVIKQKIRF